MSKQKKIKRSKRIYNRRKIPKKSIGTLVFIFLILLIVALGYFVMREWSKYSHTQEQPSSDISSVFSSELPSSSPSSTAVSDTSSQISSEAPIQKEIIRAKQISVPEMKKPADQFAADLKSWKSQGYTGIYLELKSENGTINYASQNSMAKEYGVISDSPADLAAIVAAVKAEGMLPIARVSVLKDALAPHVSRENSFGYNNSSDVNWLDNSLQNGGKPWLNPYMENTRIYITALCKEISAFGIETIVLENVNFPTQNTSKMGTLNEFTTRENILKQLVKEVEEAVGSTQVYTAFSLDQAARNENYETALAVLPGEKKLPIINLAAISANKRQICLNAGIIPAEGYQDSIAIADVAEGLLSQGDLAKDKAPLLLSLEDYQTLKPLIEKMEFGYIVK